jgi:hypothetical protein
VQVVNLLDETPLDPKPTLAGGWRWIRMRELGTGESERLEPGEVEYAVYVMGGRGSGRLEDGRSVPLREGSALTVLKGAGATLSAEESLTLFLVAADVPRR